MPKPNPGSKEALAQGCKCPVYDNNHGKGYCEDDEGRPCYVYNEGCPVHCPKEEK